MFKEYTTRLARLGVEVKVVTSNSGGVSGRVVTDGVDVRYFPWRSFFGHPVPRRRDIMPFVLWSDLVHTATYTAAPVALSAADSADKPCLMTVYEALGDKWFWVENNGLKALMFRCFEQFVVRKSYQHYHAISLATERDLASSGIRNVTTIYPGLKTDLLGASESDGQSDTDGNPAAQPSRVFLYYGRPGKTKGIFVLLEAIRRISGKIPEGLVFHFVLGKEPARERKLFENLVVQYRLNRLVEVFDPQSEADLRRTIKRAFCVIVPSITEGFGYTTAEACALGTPVIASNGGSLPEVAFGKVLFFQNRDSEDLGNKIHLATRGEWARVPRKEFTWEVAVQAMLDLYRKVIDARNGRARP